MRYILKNTGNKILIIKSNVENVSCISEGKITCKQICTKKFIGFLNTCLVNHPLVVKYSLSDDLLTKNKQDGSVVKYPKLLLQMSLIKLHNDLLISNEDGGFSFEIDRNGSVIIIYTTIIKLLPANLSNIRNR